MGLKYDRLLSTLARTARGMSRRQWLRAAACRVRRRRHLAASNIAVRHGANRGSTAGPDSSEGDSRFTPLSDAHVTTAATCREVDPWQSRVVPQRHVEGRAW